MRQHIRGWGSLIGESHYKCRRIGTLILNYVEDKKILTNSILRVKNQVDVPYNPSDKEESENWEKGPLLS